MGVFTKTYTVKIKLKSGMAQDVTIQADSVQAAKEMVEAQYGKGCIIMPPKVVR